MQRTSDDEGDASVVLKVLVQDISRLEADAVLAGFHEDVRPLKGIAGALDWVLGGSLSRLIIERKVRGALGDVALLTSNSKVGAPKVFLIGFGPRSGSSPASLRAAARNMAACAVSAGVVRAALDCFPVAGELNDEAITAVRDGLIEGAGGNAVDFSLLAPDAAAFERMSRVVRA